MNTTTLIKVRDSFESFCKKRNIDLTTATNERGVVVYLNSLTYDMWTGWQAALAQQRDSIADAMREVAEEHAHGLALDLECILADDYHCKWYNSALNRLASYREAMNAIHERESPTFLGEPVISKDEK